MGTVLSSRAKVCALVANIFLVVALAALSSSIQAATVNQDDYYKEFPSLTGQQLQKAVGFAPLCARLLIVSNGTHVYRVLGSRYRNKKDRRGILVVDSDYLKAKNIPAKAVRNFMLKVVGLSKSDALTIVQKVKSGGSACSGQATFPDITYAELRGLLILELSYFPESGGEFINVDGRYPESRFFVRDFGIQTSGMVKGEQVEEILTGPIGLTRSKALKLVLEHVPTVKKMLSNARV